MNELTTEAAAQLLGVTKPTVRKMVEHGQLRARKESRGSRFRWLIEEESVQAAQPHRLSPRAFRMAKLEAEVAELRELVRSSPGNTAQDKRRPSPRDEVEDLRADVVGLREALAKVRIAAEHQRMADAARAEVVRLLLEAFTAAERADEHRRDAGEEYEAALAEFDRPGHIGHM